MNSLRFTHPAEATRRLGGLVANPYIVLVCFVYKTEGYQAKTLRESERLGGKKVKTPGELRGLKTS